MAGECTAAAAEGFGGIRQDDRQAKATHLELVIGLRTGDRRDVGLGQCGEGLRRELKLSLAPLVSTSWQNAEDDAIQCECLVAEGLTVIAEDLERELGGLRTFDGLDREV